MLINSISPQFMGLEKPLHAILLQNWTLIGLWTISCIIRKPGLCLCKNKAPDQLIAFIFTDTDSTIALLYKSKLSSLWCHFLWQYGPFCELSKDMFSTMQLIFCRKRWQHFWKYHNLFDKSTGSTLKAQIRNKTTPLSKENCMAKCQWLCKPTLRKQKTPVYISQVTLAIEIVAKHEMLDHNLTADIQIKGSL